METKKQYSKPQLIEVGDAIKTTLRVRPFSPREFVGRRRWFPFSI
jgi:hypothetical protein